MAEEKEKSEEVFRVDTSASDSEDQTVKVEQDFDTPEDDGVVFDTSTGKGLENMEIPESMRAPAFEGGRKVRIFMNEQYAFPHGIQITAGIANHKPQLVGKPSDVERHSIDDDDIVIERTVDSEGAAESTVTLLIDPMSYQYLQGADIDYREDVAGSQFVIRNPNAKTTCGCGSSFSI